MQFLYCMCFAAVIAGLTPAVAQDAPQAEAPLPAARSTQPLPETRLPPSRVGRISLVSGDVDLRLPGAISWTDAEMNQPVFVGQALRTDPRSRAEIRIGGNTIDLSNSSEIEITSLSHRFTQIALAQGRIAIQLRQIGKDETVEIDFPRGAVWLLDPGRYDVDAGSGDRPPHIAVLEGKARFAGSSDDAFVNSGEKAVFAEANAAALTIEAAAPDAFVEWCRARDYDATRLAASYYVSPTMTGFAELDAAGVWKINSKYGAVWFPTELREWAPYRFGHWSWIAPWGWTWIDDQPWGFAPSHYGRWALIDEHWAWVPGRFVVNPLYAPAVVAFLGTPGIGLSSEEGAAVAWFPLAPEEAYWPSYTRDLDYVRQLNIGNVRNTETIGMRADGEPPLEVFREDFANRQYASIVPRLLFTTGRPVAPARVILPEQRLQNAPVLMGSPQIAPPPPSAQRIARAIPTTNALGNRTAVTLPRRPAATALPTAAMPVRGHGRPMIVRGAHLRAPSYAGTFGGRQAIVLRVAHISRAASGKTARH